VRRSRLNAEVVSEWLTRLEALVDVPERAQAMVVELGAYLRQVQRDEAHGRVSQRRVATADEPALAS
jgi:hypothetical protein